LATISKALDTTAPAYLRSVSPADARAVLEVIEGRAATSSIKEAADNAERLIGFYPLRQVTDPKTYVAGMTALMATFPPDLVRRVCDPATGLPSRLKFLPTLADVRDALDQELDRRNRIIANARWVIAEGQRRRQEAQAEAEFLKNRKSAEERAQTVAQVISNLVLHSPLEVN